MDYVNILIQFFLCDSNHPTMTNENKIWTKCLEKIEKEVVQLYTKEAKARSEYKKQRIKHLERVLGPHSIASSEERNEALAEERQLIALENESLKVLMRANKIAFD